MAVSQIGAALKTARESAGMDQEAAALAIGIHPQTLSKYERGAIKTVPAHVVEKAARVYKTTVEVLLAPDNGVSRSVPRGTANRLSDNRAEYRVVEKEEWGPNSSLRNQIPQRAYDVAISYCRRLAAAGLPVDAIDEAERLMIDNRFAKANKREKRELSDDDWVLLVDAMWDAIRETYERKGVKV